MLELLKSIPVIISMLVQLKKMWDQYIDEEKRRETMQRLSDAFKEAREKKDTSGVEALLRDIVNKS